MMRSDGGCSAARPPAVQLACHASRLLRVAHARRLLSIGSAAAGRREPPPFAPTTCCRQQQTLEWSAGAKPCPAIGNCQPRIAADFSNADGILVSLKASSPGSG